jgi:hypothetical protein
MLLCVPYRYKLSRKKFKISDDKMCPICDNSMKSKYALQCIVCKNFFDCKCINEWIFTFKHNTCPMCRAIWDYKLEKTKTNNTLIVYLGNQ